MITTKAGVPVMIIDGCKKSITGTKPFTVRLVKAPDDREHIGKLIYLLKSGIKMSNYWDTPIKLRRTELIYDNEEELYEALGLKKES